MGDEERKKEDVRKQLDEKIQWNALKESKGRFFSGSMKDERMWARDTAL